MLLQELLFCAFKVILLNNMVVQDAQGLVYLLVTRELMNPLERSNVCPITIAVRL